MGVFWSYLQFTVTFHRLHEFYTRTLLLPNASLLSLTGLIFFLPAQSGERIGFGITLTLSLCVNLLVVTGYVPETSKTIPKVCTYFLMSIFLSAAAIILAVVSINIHVWLEIRRQKRTVDQKSELKSSFLNSSTNPLTENQGLTNHGMDLSDDSGIILTSEQRVSSDCRSQSVNLESVMLILEKLSRETEAEVRAVDICAPMVILDCCVGVAFVLATNLYSICFIHGIYNAQPNFH